MTRTARLGMTTFVLLAALSACTLELDSDRAAARRLAERSETAIERNADQLELDAADIELIEDAISAVFDNAILDDIDDLDINDLDLRGVVDLDGDGIDDDGQIELVVDDATACLTLTDDHASFEIGRC